VAFLNECHIPVFLAYLDFLGVLVPFLDLVDVFCNTNHGLLGIEQAVVAMVIWIKVLQQLLWIKI